jgi:acyl carrier protein
LAASAISCRSGARGVTLLSHGRTACIGIACDRMAALRDLVGRARSGRLRSADMAEPTIIVTNLGDQGVDEVHGVIYQPQVALVGFGRIGERPWASDGMLGVRPTVRATLAADHVASDGLVGALPRHARPRAEFTGGTVNPDETRTLLGRLLHGVAPDVDLDEIDPAAPLQEAAELDSMDFLNLMTALYDETGFEVPEREYPLIATIDGFVAYVTAADTVRGAPPTG